MSDTTSNRPELSVSELSDSLKRTIESNFDHVRVRGELGRVTIARSGHMYADIKDDKAVLNTIMWKGSVSRLPFKPEEGLEVIAEGRLSIYAGRSNYQMIAESMRPAGAGALMALLEERKKKLAAEGLFDPAHKKPLPFLPRTIGVVTSPTGAVIRDILHRIRERFPVRVIVWPALVQGDNAAAQIEAGIRGFNAMQAADRPDVLIVGRGGGSIEDLWPFNEEAVVRAAFESEIPLISAVGHETDTTLIDFVSDQRAPTPTGAAEIAVPVRAELAQTMLDIEQRLLRSLTRRIQSERDRLRATRLPRPEAMLETKRQRFDHAEQNLKRGLTATIQAKRLKLTGSSSRLSARPILSVISNLRQRTGDLHQRNATAISRAIDKSTQRLASQSKLLETLSYQATLKRGYAIVRDPGGTLVRSSAIAAKQSALTVTFADGDVHTTPSPRGSTSAPPAPTPKRASPKQKEATQKPAAASSKPDQAKPDQGSLF